jgi:RimJ/RimL family protein N-acetyltransferase
MRPVSLESLETERLTLERWDERHRAEFRLMSRDPEVRRFIGPGLRLDTEEADNDFDSMLTHWEEHGFGWRSVVVKTTRRWLGFVGLSFVPRELKGFTADQVEIGWSLVRSAWGRGYATEGAARVRDEAFESVGLDRLIARLQPANIASARVAQKIGMSFERDAIGVQGQAIRIYYLDRVGWERRALYARATPARGDVSP